MNPRSSLALTKLPPWSVLFKFPKRPKFDLLGSESTSTMHTRCVLSFKSHGRWQKQASGRGTRVGAAQQSISLLEGCPPKALSTVQAIREAVAHSTCGPFADIASGDTLIINPPWAKEPRTTVTQPLLSCSLDLPGQLRASHCTICRYPPHF